MTFSARVTYKFREAGRIPAFKNHHFGDDDDFSSLSDLFHAILAHEKFLETTSREKNFHFERFSYDIFMKTKEGVKITKETIPNNFVPMNG